MINKIIEEDQNSSSSIKAKELLGSFIQEEQYIGEVYSINYESALVQIHDYYRQKVGGIPNSCFLIATRINPNNDIDYKKEDSSVILLRVIDSATLPNDIKKLEIRVQSAERSTGEEYHWDEEAIMDEHTNQLLSYAGIKCKIVGTFYLEKENEKASDDKLVLKFGSDISNYYPNKGLKVYKPNNKALEKVVNYQEVNQDDPYSIHRVHIGHMRYASTNRLDQGISNVKVSITPSDFRGQKTALFGMTRTGKSNTTKILIKSIFELRFKNKKPLRIGQLVFDPNGEYANENTQDGGKDNPTAIKNVWKLHQNGNAEDVVTYGLQPHPNDPNRKLTKINFFDKNTIQQGKELINNVLIGDSSKYIRNFINIEFIRPDQNDRSAMTRYGRRVLAYYSLLAKAGFDTGNNRTFLKFNGTNLFNKKIIDSLKKDDKYKIAGEYFEKDNPSWDELIKAFEKLIEYMDDKNSDYKKFEENYIKTSSTGDNWADDDFKTILTMFKYANGSRQVAEAKVFHEAIIQVDYAQEIYNDLCKGKLVIIDQSLGDEIINKSSAEKIMRTIFKSHSKKFSLGKEPESITIFIEEAHNLLPKGSDDDTSNVWARVAKEGAKYFLGMVYSTQEPSSIQRNILKNTYNWFVAHLNNSDEVREVAKYYDFEDFKSSILKAQDKGFLRVKTLSNPFVIPVQIDKFEV